jgi:5-(carboxyamino)imidazole ribonucleotide synthase
MLIGVLGGGQLGRMLGLAGVAMGMRFRFLDPSPDAPAKDVGELVVGDFTDAGAVERFARGLDAATFEFENVPSETVRLLARHTTVHPNADALEVAQDRASEKRFFEKAGLDVHPWAEVDALDGPRGLGVGVEKVGLPAVLKTRRGGYDGKGQAVLRGNDRGRPGRPSPRGEGQAESLSHASAWETIGRRPAIVEAMVPFSRELSIVAVRGRDGSFAAYPLIENRHQRGILRESRAPALGVAREIEAAADAHCRTLMEAMGYVGVLAVEFFEHEGRLLTNEMAPRVHNSGHWTIEAADTSQFENHLRAVLGWPLGSCKARGASVMHNLIGGVPDAKDVLAVPRTHLHLYAKEPREARKIGHVTICGENASELDDRSSLVREMVVRSARG